MAFADLPERERLGAAQFVRDFRFAFRLCRLPTGPGTADPLGPPPRGFVAALRYAWRDARVVRPRVREDDRVKYG
ncbi:MAG TPA: hypothetical protein VGN13_05565 [Solirubrobacteraceae bacterium]|jgi:hypothetical protein